MIHSKRITTTVIAASSLAAALPGESSAHHIVGHSTVSAVQQDIRTAAVEAERQVSSVRAAIENTGAATRRHLIETVETQVRSAERIVSRTRSSAKAQVESAREAAEQRVAPVVSRVRTRAAQTRAQGEERAERTVAAGRSRAQRTQSAAERRVERTRAHAEDQYAMAKRRARILAYRITREVDALVASGSVSVSTSGGDYSAGWTRSGACWTGRLSTPLNPPNSRVKRRTGATAEPVKGQRTSADTSNGDVTASTGC